MHVVRDKDIRVTIPVIVRADAAHAWSGFLRDAGFVADVGIRSVTVVAKERVGIRVIVPRAGKNSVALFRSFELLVVAKVNVIRHEQVQVPVRVVIEKARSRADPVSVADAGARSPARAGAWPSPSSLWANRERG